MKRKIYVVGFAFSPDRKAVALIEKSNPHNAEGNERPKWLKGKYNGIGTDIQKGEEPIDAMVRTFKQRTGVLTEDDVWEQYAQINNDEAVVLFYRTVLPAVYWGAIATKTRETVHRANIHQMQHYPIVENLKWLIPMALDEGHNFSMSLDMGVPQIEGAQQLMLVKYPGDEEKLDAMWNDFLKETAPHLTRKIDSVTVEFEGVNYHDIILNAFRGMVKEIAEKYVGLANVDETHNAIALELAERMSKVNDAVWDELIGEDNHHKMNMQIKDSDFDINVYGREEVPKLIVMLAQKIWEVSHSAIAIADLADYAVMEVRQIVDKALEIIKAGGSTPETWTAAEDYIIKAVSELPPATGNRVKDGIVPGAEGSDGGVKNSSEGIGTGGSENNSNGGGQKSEVKDDQEKAAETKPAPAPAAPQTPAPKPGDNKTGVDAKPTENTKKTEKGK